MIVLDASVLIAHFSPADVFHCEATELLKAHVKNEFLMHTLTMTEVFVGPVRVNRDVFVEQQLAALEIQEWTPPPTSALRLAKLRVETGLKLPDCCVLDAAKMNRAAIATFDKSLAREAAAIGVVTLR